MATSYQFGLGKKLQNGVVRGMLALGMGGDMRLLTVAGRKTGKPRSTSVTLIVEGDDRWLVAPYGERDWVKNMRAAGRGTLAKGRKREAISVAELPPDEAGPVIRLYVKRVPITKSYWDVTPDSPPEAFVAEAARHPVFRIAAETAD